MHLAATDHDELITLVAVNQASQRLRRSL